MSNIIVIDVGTSSMRGILYDEAGTVLCCHQEKYTPDYLSDILVEQNPLIWKQGLISLAALLAEYAKQNSINIEVISLTAQRSSLIPVDRQGDHLTNAVMWQDKRTVPICEELAPLNDEVFHLAGSRINPVFTASKITWLRRSQPEIYKKAYKTVVIADYLNFIMTGCFKTDYSYGSRTLLMNVRNRCWDNRLLTIFEAEEEKLCELVPPGSIIGYVKDSFAHLTGIAAGTPVVTAGGDQQCAALGLGVMEEGNLEITAGTGAYLLAACNTVPKDLQDNIICGASAVEGQYCLESTIPASCSVFDWFVRNFYKDAEEKNRYRKIDAEIAEVPVGANGVIALPCFQGRGTPDWNSSAKGAFSNVTLTNTRADFARAILEGISYEIANNLDVIYSYVTSDQIKSIGISGGLTKNAVFDQMLSDVCNKQLIKYSNNESTALGAWISASVAVGMYSGYRQAFEAVRKNDGQAVFVPAAANFQKYSAMRREFNRVYNCVYVPQR